MSTQENFRKVIFPLILIMLTQIFACKDDKHQIGDISLSDCNSFTDSRDGNTYNTVKIVNRCWMSENLKYLPYVNLVAESSDSVELYYVYDYHGTDLNEAKSGYNYNTFGVLYNWSAAMSACPPGWHLPSDDEWKSLEISLGMSPQDADTYGFRGFNEASKLAGNKNLWTDAVLVNDFEFGQSGFKAIPGGGRSVYGNFFYGLSYYCFLWSSSNTNEALVHGRTLFNADTRVLRFSDYKQNAFSVRCVKD